MKDRKFWLNFLFLDYTGEKKKKKSFDMGDQSCVSSLDIGKFKN